MKKLIWLVCAAACVALAAGAAADDLAWFDKNCGMCSSLFAEEGLMDHMEMETHAISDGMLSIVTVDAEYLEAFNRAHKNMEATGAKLMAGEQMPLCGCCTSYGQLMMAGAHMENVGTHTGMATLLTSTDPEVVNQIKAHVERHQKETAAMEAHNKAKS